MNLKVDHLAAETHVVLQFQLAHVIKTFIPADTSVRVYTLIGGVIPFRSSSGYVLSLGNCPFYLYFDRIILLIWYSCRGQTFKITYHEVELEIPSF